MQADNSNEVQHHDQLSEITNRIMNFIHEFHRYLQQGSEQVDYNEDLFPLPTAVKETIKTTVLEFKDSGILQEYSQVLSQPDPIDFLTICFIDSLLHFVDYLNEQEDVSDADFFVWTIMCCVISADLHDKGFEEAPLIAKGTIRTMCINHEKSHLLLNLT